MPITTSEYHLPEAIAAGQPAAELRAAPNLSPAAAAVSRAAGRDPQPVQQQLTRPRASPSSKLVESPHDAQEMPVARGQRARPERLCNAARRKPEPRDRFERFNRSMYSSTAPLTDRAGTAGPRLRSGSAAAGASRHHHFIDNYTYPRTIATTAARQAGGWWRDTLRLVVNTVGVASSIPQSAGPGGE
jgi:hypothetical protein